MSEKLAIKLLNSLGMPADEAGVFRLSSLGSAYLKRLLQYREAAEKARAEPLGLFERQAGGSICFGIYEDPLFPRNMSEAIWVETDHGKVLEKRSPAFSTLRSSRDLERITKNRDRKKATRGLDKPAKKGKVIEYVGSLIVRSLATGWPLRDVLPHHLRPYAPSMECLASGGVEECRRGLWH